MSDRYLVADVVIDGQTVFGIFDNLKGRMLEPTFERNSEVQAYVKRLDPYGEAHLWNVLGSNPVP